MICVDRQTAAPPCTDGLIDRRDIARGAGRWRLRTAIVGRAIRGLARRRGGPAFDESAFALLRLDPAVLLEDAEGSHDDRA